jgi:hypothetical protein
MPRRNRNSDREPINRDRLIDEAARFARELIPHDPVQATGETQAITGLRAAGGDF